MPKDKVFYIYHCVSLSLKTFYRYYQILNKQAKLSPSISHNTFVSNTYPYYFHIYVTFLPSRYFVRYDLLKLTC